MRIVAHHRNAALAERHRRALEREHGQPFSITARRNAQGGFSERGHTFTFESGKLVEYVLHFSYVRRRKRRVVDVIHVQVHMKGPDGLNLNAVKDVYTKWFRSGTLPKGWTVALIRWGPTRAANAGFARSHKTIMEARDRLAFVLSTSPTI